MADATYQPKVYRSQGSTSFVAASGGSIEAESGAEVNLQAGAIMTNGGTTMITSTGKLKPPFGFALPVETLTSGQGDHTKTLRAGSAIHLFNISTAVEWFKMPTPSSGDIKYLYNVGGSTQVIIESTNGATHVWTSTGSNRIRFEYAGASAVVVATSSTGWRLVASETSTGVGLTVDLSTST